MKRALDLILGVLAAVVLAAPCAILALAIRFTSPGPALYWSDRVGRNNAIFRMPKFRSMRIDTPTVATHLLEKPEAWLTPMGSFLRQSSLDELPQLFNILKGDISIVGPRPVMEVETEIYGNYRDMLLSVKPGLTGFWAANGRSCTTYTRRRAMEICYIKNRSVCFDLKIILKTITSVFKGEGAV